MESWRRGYRDREQKGHLNKPAESTTLLHLLLSAQRWWYSSEGFLKVSSKVIAESLKSTSCTKSGVKSLASAKSLFVGEERGGREGFKEYDRMPEPQNDPA